MDFQEAVRYTGGGTLDEWRSAIQLQLQLLQDAGLTPQASILEIGAGCLGLAHKLVEYLAPGNYTGIEPHVEVAQAGNGLNPSRAPVLLHREDFDPTESGRTFDIVFAHSVLTHVAGAQLGQFLRNVKPHLRPNGFILASLRWGKDTNASQWTYPGAVWFSSPTVQQVASQEGFLVEVHDEMRLTCEAALPRMFHDWVVFRPFDPTR